MIQVTLADLDSVGMVRGIGRLSRETPTLDAMNPDRGNRDGHLAPAVCRAKDVEGHHEIVGFRPRQREQHLPVAANRRLLELDVDAADPLEERSLREVVPQSFDVPLCADTPCRIQHVGGDLRALGVQRRADGAAGHTDSANDVDGAQRFHRDRLQATRPVPQDSAGALASLLLIQEPLAQGAAIHFLGREEHRRPSRAVDGTPITRPCPPPPARHKQPEYDILRSLPDFP